MSRRYKDYIMLYLLAGIIKRFENDEAPLTAHEIAIRDKLPIRLVNQLLSRLEETHIVREVYVEGKEDRTFQPALDTHKISVGMVIGRIEKQGTEEFLQSPTPEMQEFWERYIRIKDEHQTMDQILVDEI
jgi:DNA-binding transcriptional ArsR family regulator